MRSLRLGGQKYRGSDVEHGQEILKQIQVLQYFFPAADHLALGLLEKQPLTSDLAAQNLQKSPTFRASVLWSFCHSKRRFPKSSELYRTKNCARSEGKVFLDP